MAKTIPVEFGSIKEGFMKVKDIKAVAKGFRDAEGVVRNMIYTDLSKGATPSMTTTVPFEELKKLVEESNENEG